MPPILPEPCVGGTTMIPFTQKKGRGWVTGLRSSGIIGQDLNSEILNAQARLLALMLESSLTHTNMRIKFVGDLPFPADEFLPRLVSSSIANKIICFSIWGNVQPSRSSSSRDSPQRLTTVLSFLSLWWAAGIWWWGCQDFFWSWGQDKSAPEVQSWPLFPIDLVQF